MSPAPHIRILMCTLNGAAYLHDQLGSFLRQSHEDWSLWVSDDGSGDASMAILRAFQAENPDRDIRLFDGPGRGAAANYLSLMRRFTPEPGVLVALSDQDDVWFPKKLARAARAIAAAPGSGQSAGPVAYAAAQIIGDAGLKRQRPSRAIRAGPSFGNALVQNILSGNSLVLDPAAQRLVQRTLPSGDVPFHDWWIYQLVTGAGGWVIYDPEPALIYRQHGTNTLGGNRGLRAIRHRATMIWGHEYTHWIRANTAALEAASEALTPDNRVLLGYFLARLGRGGPARARWLGRLGVKRQSRAGTLVMFLAAMLGRV